LDRAIVLIGVQRTGGLPLLPAVGDSIGALRKWAAGQGIPGEKIAVVSDLDGRPVGAEAVFDAVYKLAQSPTLQQLLIYFCGHGIVNNRNEFWLLSAAPSNPNAAVNVVKSAELAATGTIPHVVFISDACRTAATTINAQGVTGSVILPNLGVVGPYRAVDLFYPCLLGEPSFEVKDPVEATKYHALYTEVLPAGLSGSYPEALEQTTDAGQAVGLVRPRLLADSLPERTLDRAQELSVGLSFNQRPDARITSDSKVAWLARIASPDAPALTIVPDVPVGEGAPVYAAPPPRPTRSGIRGTGGPVAVTKRSAPEQAAAAAAERLISGRLTGAHAPDGLVVEGAGIEAAYATTGFQRHGQAVRLSLPPSAASANVLLRLDSGVCAVIPVLRGYSAILTVEGSQLVDVWYGRPGQAGPSAVAAWRARAGIATRSRFGLPVPLGGWPDPADDPALAVYHAYALADAGRRQEIAVIQQRLGERTGVPLFDIDLLIPRRQTVAVPGFPLLGRGWALLDIDSASPATAIPRPLSSHWTLFPESAFGSLQAMLERN